MRLISQDGRIDMPYEGFVLACNDETIVVSRDVYSSLKAVIAKYSSKQKIVEVMKKLRFSFKTGEEFFHFPKDSEVEV